jgi:hypothetical protein
MWRIIAVAALAGCSSAPAQPGEGFMDNLLMSPAQRCQEAREAYADILEPTLEHQGLMLAACAQHISGG